MKNTADGKVVQMRDFRASDFGKQIGEALSSVTQSLSSVSDSFFDEWDKMATRAKKTAAVTDDFVRDSPWAAAGIAAVCGIAVGYFIARAGRSDAEELSDG